MIFLHIAPPQICESVADRAQFLGLINDDSDEVGAVHAGLAFQVELHPAEKETLQIREISKMRGHFGSLAGSSGLWQYRDFMESWSRLLVGAISPLDRDSRLHSNKEGTNRS